jgi:hypothetical protein
MVVVGADLVLLSDAGVEWCGSATRWTHAAFGARSRMPRRSRDDHGPHATEFVPWVESEPRRTWSSGTSQPGRLWSIAAATRDAEFLRRELLDLGIAVGTCGGDG